MDDDFNTAEAMAVLFDLANEVNKNSDSVAASLLFKLAGMMGLLQRNVDDFMQGETSAELDVDAMILARIEAKKAKNFSEADRIRKELAEAGIILEDTPQGTTWRRA